MSCTGSSRGASATTGALASHAHAGIAAVGDLKRVGKTGVIAAIYFEVVSTIAIGWGLLAATLLGVGKGIGHIATNDSLVKGAQSAEDAAAGAQT